MLSRCFLGLLLPCVLGAQDGSCARRRDAENALYTATMRQLDARRAATRDEIELARIELDVKDEETRHNKALVDVDVACFVPSVGEHRPCPKEDALESRRYYENIMSLKKDEYESGRVLFRDYVGCRTQDSRCRSAADDRAEQRGAAIRDKVTREQHRHEQVVRELDRGNCGATYLQGAAKDTETVPPKGPVGGQIETPVVDPGPHTGGIATAGPRDGGRTPDNGVLRGGATTIGERLEIDWAPWYDRLKDAIATRFFRRVAQLSAGPTVTLRYRVDKNRRMIVDESTFAGSGNPAFDRIVREVIASVSGDPVLQFPSARRRDGTLVLSRRDCVTNTAVFTILRAKQVTVTHTAISETEFLRFEHGTWTSTVYPQTRSCY